MNERIKEFRFKAAEYANEQKPLGITKWNEMRDEKFAELIVRECMKVAGKQRKPANLNYNPSERFAEDLRQHFGVSE